MLRFTTTAYAGNTPKNIIRRSTTQSLQDMLQPGGYLNPPSNTLYYEMLDVSIIELETKRFLKVIWLGTSAKEEVRILCVSRIRCLLSIDAVNLYHIIILVNNRRSSAQNGTRERYIRLYLG